MRSVSRALGLSIAATVGLMAGVTRWRARAHRPGRLGVALSSLLFMRRRRAMPDLAFVLLTVALFGALALVLRAVERL
jgi:hypothetical protein